MVDRQSIDEMSRLLALLGNEGAPATQSAHAPQSQAVAVRSGHPDPNVAAMKSILESFNGFAEDVVDDAMNNPVKDVALREAMLTEETDDGVTIGRYAIHVREAGARKFYDVTNTADGSRLAADLTLYEAAYGLACALHQGQPITSRKVRDLLIAEEAYANAVHDMIHFKERIKKGKIAARRPMMEDRYEAARGLAVSARDRVHGLARLAS